MKLSLNRIVLLSQLQTVARATATRSAIQALAGVLLSADDGVVELAATDTEIGVRSQVEAAIERPGSVLVPGRLLVDILRAISSEEITLENRPEQGNVEVAGAQARFALKVLPTEDFPRLPSLPADGALQISASVFASTIDRVARAASRDETRPVLTGILVSVSGDELRMVATDSYRLSVKETPVKTADDADQFEVNVPARALQELSRIIADGDTDHVSIVASENQIVFGVGGITLSSRMIEGQFPNYHQLLPESYEHEIRLDRGEFQAVVRRISLMAQRNAPLRLRFEEGSVTVSAQTPDVGEATETIPVNYSGDLLEIGFNPQFLQDGLDAVDADELLVKLISPLRPGLIEASAGKDQEEGRFLYLIMPVRLNV
jgi:DNA polymerase III subunit beta